MASSTIDLTRAESGLYGFTFSGLIVSGQRRSAQSFRRVQLVVASLLLHATVIGGLVVAPLLRASALPDPANAVNTFFVVPTLAPPPAPPPPPAASRAVVVPRAKADAPRGFTAPVEIPDTIETASDLDTGIQGGEVGGVAGGVAGGVVGGVVGGILDAAPITKPVRVGGEIREPRKLVNVKPVYPEVARQVRVQGIVLIDCLIDPHGNVVDARVVDGIPLLNEAALAAVRQWRYTPTLFGGVPVPVQMTVMVNFHIA
jgi:periplasmic protein TonB